MKLGRFGPILVFGAILSLILAACGGGEEEAAPQPTKPPVATSAPAATTAPGAQATATPRPTAAPTPTPTAVPVPTGALTLALPTLFSFALFPFPTNQSTSPAYIDALYDMVIGVTQKGKLEFTSGFATSATPNENSTVWTLKTRNGVAFTNGDPATSKDVAFGIRLFTSKESQYTRGFDLVRVLTKIETPDDQTVVFTLSQPNIFFPHTYLSPIQLPPYTLWPQKYVESVGVGEANKKPVGSGPYKFKSIVIGDRIVLEAVDKHWYYGVPRIKTFSFLQIPEENTRVALLKTGDADFSPVTEQSAAPLKAAGVRLFTESGQRQLLVFPHAMDKPLQNGDLNPLAKEDVRKAMNWYALDRAALAAAFFPISGQVAVDWPATYVDAAYDPSSTLPVPPYDPNKARALLAQAGYPKGFEIDAYIWSPDAQEAMEAIFVYWEQIGIKVKRIPIALATHQAQSIVFSKDGWKKPSVSHTVMVFRPIAGGNHPLISHNPAGPFYASTDPEAIRLGNAYAGAATLNDYIKFGREYQKYQYEHLAGWWPVIVVGTLFAGSNKLPKDWQPRSNTILDTASLAASR